MRHSERTGSELINAKITVARRVLVIQTGSLLEECVELLLTHHTGLQVSSIVFQGEPEFIQAVSGIYPDVIVLNGDSSLDFSQMIKLLGEALGSAPFTVITVRADSNYIDIYERRNVLLTDSRDLLDALSAQRLND